MIDTKKLQLIGTKTSESAARVIINDNFSLLKDRIEEVAHVSIFDVAGINFRKPLTSGASYVLRYLPDNTFEMRQAFNDGIRYDIPEGDDAYVPRGNQYIVNNYLFVKGSMVIDGEVVIL